ncbi:MAG: O-antigen ligase family protein [Nitrospira sp.]|nr:O-antigen ligase family protein [Nitrospira sp.]
MLGIFIVLMLFIIFRRKIDWSGILKDNLWLAVLVLYTGLSILWSDIPFVSFKRWVRSAGDILMALVVLSERMPFQALESVLRRSAYILIPFSLMLIHYFPFYGRAYGRYSGIEMWTGVTLHKSSLGPLCAISALFMIWALLREWRAGTLFKISPQNLADAFVLIMTIIMLWGPGVSFSATSVSIVVVSTVVMLVLYRMQALARYVGRQLKAITVVFVSLYLLLFDSLVEISASILGRDTTLTGRTDIWRPLLDFASQSPIFGVGYGGFWAPGNQELEELFSPQFILAQSHNGYLAVYVELGITGIVLLALFILAYCGKVGRELSHASEWGVFGICFLVMSMLYNNTEASFLQSVGNLWPIMALLAVVCSRQSLATDRNRFCM